MNNTETIQLLGKNYPKDNIKYSYTGSKMRYKRFLKYPIIFFLLDIVGAIISALVVEHQYGNFIKKLDLQGDLDTQLQAISARENVLTNINNILQFLAISSIIAFIILLIPRISCLFLKIDGIKKDIVLYKSIHKDEVALIANEINTKIKENDFSSFPY